MGIYTYTFHSAHLSYATAARLQFGKEQQSEISLIIKIVIAWQSLNNL